MESSPNGYSSFETVNTMVDQPSGLASPGITSSTKQPVEEPGSTTVQSPAPSSPAPPIIPDSHPFRTLVLCFDGTGDQFDSDNSNIVQFFSMLPKADRNKQMVYYQHVLRSLHEPSLTEINRAGIGTYTRSEIATPFASKISKVHTRFPSGGVYWVNLVHR